MINLSLGERNLYFERAGRSASIWIKYFLDGTHSTCESLSCVERLEKRSCQPMEQSNRIKNEIMKDIRPAGPISGEDWLELAATLEKRALDRLFSIQNHQDWKGKKRHKLHEIKLIKHCIMNMMVVILTDRNIFGKL